MNKIPTYEYVCQSCGHDFEIMQSITAPVKKKCPKCKKNKLKRLIGAGSALIFKGSGFYCNDYKSDNYKKSVEPKSINKSINNKKIKKGPAKLKDK